MSKMLKVQVCLFKKNENIISHDKVDVPASRASCMNNV